MRRSFLFILLFGVAASLTAAPIALLPVPDDMAQGEAMELVSDIYKSDYSSAKTPEQKVALAKKLLADGVGTKDDAAGKYVLLRISRDIAAQQGELALAFEAIDQIAASFEVDALLLKSEAATTASKTTRRTVTSGETAAALLNLINQAVAADRYDTAKKFVDVATSQARIVKDLDQVKRLGIRAKELEELEKQFAKVKDAQMLLKTNPSEPAANQTVGWFQCAVKGDWNKGVLMLALGNDENLKSLAKAEIVEGPVPLELADGWWKVGEGFEGLSKSHIQRHSIAWYHKAMPTLTGLSKTKVLKRIGEWYSTFSVPKQANGLFKEVVDCTKNFHEIQVGARFDPTKSWLMSAEVKIPAFETGLHALAIWGDDRVGLDPITLLLDGKALYGGVDNFDTNKREAVGIELPANVQGKWTKLAFVYRAEESALQLYVNDALVADGACSFKLRIDRPMPVRIGGAGGESMRFRGEMRNVVLTNFP